MIGKPWLLLISLLIVIAVAVLASSMHDVHFEPGRAIAVPQESLTMPAVPPEASSVQSMPLWKVLLFWLAFVLNLVLFFYLLPPAARKRVIRQMISLALGVLAVLLALRYRLIQLPSLATDPVSNTIPNSPLSGTGEPLPNFEPPHVAPWYVFLISFVVLSVLLLGLWSLYRWWARQGAHRYRELNAIGAIAQSSLNDLAAGHEWRDVIIQSYIQMSEAVIKGRGLQRHRAATPREFADRLEQAGMPATAVHRLTRLFESARYGARASSQSDVNEAVACLNSILQACGQVQ